MKQYNNETMERGVSLYLGLMIMIILLAIGLGISTIIISQMKMIRGMEDSVIAFYAADTGIEKTVFYDNQVKPDGARGLCYMDSNCTAPDCIWDCTGCGENPDGTDKDCGDTTCTDCTIIYESDFNGKRYRVEATVSGGMTTIKSSGDYKGTKRAIKVTHFLPKKVFVTSGAYGGNLGRLAGADSICQNLANAAGLPGTYKAWLSDSINSPAGDPDATPPIPPRFTFSKAPYKTVTGVLIANDWNDLTDGTIQNPINVNEIGGVNNNEEVWTNTDIYGRIYSCDPFFSGGCSCLNWTSSEHSLNYVGWTGNSGQTDYSWIDSLGAFCNGVNRLYCFEQ